MTNQPESESVTQKKPPHPVNRQQLQRLAWWLDERFELPVVGIRLGLDSIIGLVPIAGDIVTTLVSGYLIWQARRAGAPNSMQGKMLGNVAVDLLAGLIPFIGDIADVAVRANKSNMELLNAHLDELERPKSIESGPPKWLKLLLLATALGLVYVAYQHYFSVA